MILRRMGNKSKIADDIIRQFPDHEVYVELFFGAGGLFFNKPLAKYNFLNDLDSDIFNLYDQLIHNKEELKEQFMLMPVHHDLFKYWEKHEEVTPVLKAVRFLMISNMGLYGATGSLRLGCSNSKQMFLEYINDTFNMIQDCHFLNCDFRKVLPKITFQNGSKHEVLVYADPPYLGCRTYKDKYTEQDTIDLFEMLVSSGHKFAISEFDNPVILDLADKHKLRVITIGERTNVKNRRTEILVVNYQKRTSLWY